MQKKLIFISLNELNFDLIKSYLHDPKLKNFKSLSKKIYKTDCYEEYQNLEPWIQWPTIYTGKSASEHKQFRLGDAVNFDHKTIFNEVENLGISVGVISPMNLKNNLKSPSYFIPDPWTDTHSDKNFMSSITAKTISYFVKSNSHLKFDIKYWFYLFFIFLRYFRISNFLLYLKLFFSSFNFKWRKALFLDLLLSDIHYSLFKKKKPDFSHFFLNGFAHIQHHYMFNSKFFVKKNSNPTWYINPNSDPIRDALLVYEKILDDYFDEKNTELIIATGLTQVPYDRTKFYYRLKNHQIFFEKLGFKIVGVQELMSRDFYLIFANTETAKNAFYKIANISDENNKKIFGDVQQIDNKLFVSFVYDIEIKDQKVQNCDIKILDFVNFVALKNGMHSSKGFIYTSFNSKFLDVVNITKVKEMIFNFFNKKNYAD